MRNRAKCKLCQSIVESLSEQDYQLCECFEIAVDGGPEGMLAYAHSWENFIRLDDDDNEIIPKIVNKHEEKPQSKESDKEIITKTLETMIEAYENLPEAAMTMPITHYDMLTLLYMIKRLTTIEG